MTDLFEHSFYHFVSVVNKDEGVAIHDVISAQVSSDHYPVLGQGFGCSCKPRHSERQDHESFRISELQPTQHAKKSFVLGASILHAVENHDGFFLCLVAQRAASRQLASPYG
jgi:hypothetical protein